MVAQLSATVANARRRGTASSERKLDDEEEKCKVALAEEEDEEEKGRARESAAPLVDKREPEVRAAAEPDGAAIRFAAFTWRSGSRADAPLSFARRAGTRFDCPEGCDCFKHLAGQVLV